MFLLVVFGVQSGPLSTVHACQTHPASHSEAEADEAARTVSDHGGWAAGAHGAHSDEHSTAHRSPMESEGDEGGAHQPDSDFGEPCDCLGNCLACFVGLPVQDGDAAPAVASVSHTPSVLASLLTRNPRSFLTPEAIPPPARVLL